MDDMGHAVPMPRFGHGSSHIWAASYNMLWNKVYAARDQAVFIGPSRKPRNRNFVDVVSNFYIVAEKVRTTRQLLRCSLVQQGGDNACLQVVRPFEFLSSVHLFMDQWDEMRAGANLAAYSLGFANLRVSDCSSFAGAGHIIADVRVTSCSKMFDLQKKQYQKADKDDDAACAPEALTGQGPDHASNEDDDQDYGMSLLQSHVASCLHTSSANVTEQAAASASVAEACALPEDILDEAAVHDMVGNVAANVDNDLDLMHRVEQEMLRQAVAQQAVSIEELKPQVDRMLSQGVHEEDAVFEAAMNSAKLMGNLTPENTPATQATREAADPPHASSSSAVPEVVFPMSSQQASECSFVTYTSAFSEGVRALLQCLHGCANSVPHSGSLSLAYSPVEVAGMPSFASSRRLVLLSWEVAGRTAHVARVDQQGRLVSMVCVGANRSARDLSACAMVHPSIGVSMERVRKKERTQIPDFIMRMANMVLQAESMQMARAEEEVRRADSMTSKEPWHDVAHAGEQCLVCVAQWSAVSQWLEVHPQILTELACRLPSAAPCV